MNSMKRYAIVISALLLSGLGGTATAAGKTADLRKQIDATRQNYFALYNALNDNPKYDIVCHRFDRQCMPRYLDVATKTAWKGCGVFPEPQHPCPSIAIRATANAEEMAFRENVREVFARSPELQVLGRKLETLQAQR